jgi:hypothetical protein
MKQQERKLRDKREFIKYLLLDIITLGLYEAFMLSNISKEINLISKDGKRTMNYLPLFLMFVGGVMLMVIAYFLTKNLLVIDPDLWSEKDLTTVITGSFVILFGVLLMIIIGISIVVWMCRITKRISNELSVRNIDAKFCAKTFWLFYFVYFVYDMICSGVCDVLGIELVWEYVICLPGYILYYTFMFKLIKAMNLLNADYNQKGE